MTTPWAHRYALRTHGMGSSAIRELLKLTQQPDLISFAGGLPAPEMFPTKEVQAACDVVLTEMGAQALQYSTTEGYPPLRELIVRHMARYGIKVGIDNVVITSGSQQALDLIGKLLINPGDRILTENPTYLGALQAFTAYQSQYVTVPIDDDGLQVEHLEAALRSGPKFMYILPNFQNPAGVTLSLTRRYDLIALADEYGVPIVEDDPYGQLRYEGEHLKPLVVLDSEYLGCEGDGGYTGNVIVHNGMLDEDANFIQKPFRPDQLANKVRQVLGPARPLGRVLVVDDEEGVRSLLRGILERAVQPLDASPHRHRHEGDAEADVREQDGGEAERHHLREHEHRQ